MRAVSLPARAPAAPLRSRRLLALAGDGRLVEQVRRGNEAAFEVVFERHAPAILAFCRHMLGTREEAEDAVQHTFAAAYRDLQRGGDREIVLKPWLFTIARNRCLSVLRARREVPTAVDALDSASASGAAGLAEQVEERADLRILLADVRELPDEQRAALLLTELGDLSHVEVAGVLGCEVSRVKGLVFRARSALIARREAREMPCESIREQLANLRGGSLRRSELRLHLRECPGCRAYREKVREQRRMLAAALPVVPTLGLKSSVLAAVGIGGGSAGGLTAAAGGIGGATVAKVAVAGVLAGGGVVAGTAVVESERPAAPESPATQQLERGDANARRAAEGGAPAGDRGRTHGADRGAAGDRSALAGGGASRGAADRAEKRAFAETPRGRGRGPIDHPTKVPVRRGPPTKPWKAERGAGAAPQGQAKGHAKGAPGSKANPGPRANGRTKPSGNPNGTTGGKPAPGAGSQAGAKSNGGSRSNGGARSNGGSRPSAGSRSSAGSKPRTGALPKLGASVPGAGVNRLAQPQQAPNAGAGGGAPTAGQEALPGR
jgi:RNA polymerase sigma factor (sigma-70 family)